MARIITREEAITISQKILEEAERDRLKYAEDEAKEWIQYDK